MKKSLKMAIASSGGKIINQHFGKARQFIIIESDGKDINKNKMMKSENLIFIKTEVKLSSIRGEF